MKEKKKGDVLELMVFILEKSLCDNPNTRIETNRKVKDRDGIDREVDIYVTTYVNGLSLKYAFECKDYKRGIELKHIVDFHSRLETNGILGLFVTSSYYQSGAIAKAKALGIQLLRLKKREVHTDSISALLFARKLFRVSDVQVVGDPFEGRIVNEIVNGCSDCREAMHRRIEKDFREYIQEQLENGLEEIFPETGHPTHILKHIGEKRAKELQCVAQYEDASFTHEGKLIPFGFIAMKLHIWWVMTEHKPVEVNSFSYIKHDDEGLRATFSMSEFFIEGERVIASVSSLNTGETKFTIGNPANKDKLDVSNRVLLGGAKDYDLGSPMEDKDAL
ncbi:restriction endonuclease [Flaviaesturariibacter amylovorans]|uniref:Restriction endonuclease type IV Mrr domain-containing protein n=1 Tax=Flaviaesturariibacter amylovorans TaxID=1084520 RepID=A0ABP8H6I7_9BACT